MIEVYKRKNNEKLENIECSFCNKNHSIVDIIEKSYNDENNHNWYGIATCKDCYKSSKHQYILRFIWNDSITNIFKKN